MEDILTVTFNPDGPVRIEVDGDGTVHVVKMDEGKFDVCILTVSPPDEGGPEVVVAGLQRYEVRIRKEQR